MNVRWTVILETRFRSNLRRFFFTIVTAWISIA